MNDTELKQRIIGIQRSEITEHFIYKRLAKLIKEKNNQELLLKIAVDELKHYEFWKGLSGETVLPNKIKIIFYTLIVRMFGLTFGVKLMESGEGKAQDVYNKLRPVVPNIDEVIQDEKRHEEELLGLIDEERLKYVSSMVLGLNDALVELTGALVGFTLALQKTMLVAVVGLITGIAAAMSMAASAYLSAKHEETDGKNPVKASIYTGVAYIFTVIILVLPYFIFSNIFICLSLVIINALIIIFLFTFYTSVAKDLSFKKRFLEMAGISLGIAAINYVIGLGVRKLFGIVV